MGAHPIQQMELGSNFAGETPEERERNTTKDLSARTGEVSGSKGIAKENYGPQRHHVDTRDTLDPEFEVSAGVRISSRSKPQGGGVRASG